MASDPPSHHPDTVATRAGGARSPFDETSEALYLNSGYVYASAAEAEAAFDGSIQRFRYSRVGSPTVRMFEDRVAAIEGAEAAQATATGMAAVFNALIATISAGDRVVAARSLFGSCYIVATEILPRFGVQVDVVDGTDLGEWTAALSTPADVVFCESPSNPMQDLIDLEAVADLAHAAGAIVVVDNAFVSPVLQRPLELGADVVTYSTTKHMDGQGRTMGGVILGTQGFIDQVKPLIRHTGPSMSPFNAWVVLKSLETMRLRVEHQSATAGWLAEHLAEHPLVQWIRYPFHPSHPQHELARQQMSGGGTVVTFSVEGGRDASFRLLDSLRLIDISNNFADAKSLACHPATTTHQAMGQDGRDLIGLGDGVVRLSVGLEDRRDLLADVEQALRAAAPGPR